MKHTLLLAQLVCAAAESAGCTRETMLSGQRNGQMAKHRHAAMWLAANGKFSLPQIGRAFGRDHTTIIHGRDRVAKVISASERDALLRIQPKTAIGLIAGRL